MSIEENRARYEGTGLQRLMEASEHTICPRCYCCDEVTESAPCPYCGGFVDYDDEWDDSDCSECHGEGTIYFRMCIGRCDQDGNHKSASDECVKVRT